MKKILILILAIGQFDAFAIPHTSISENYLQLMNNHRASLGLRPLLESGHIAEVAERHSKHMAKGRVLFGHGGWKNRCGKIKYRMGQGNLCGEIIARGQKDPRGVLRAWLNSPPHRRVIEGRRYTHTGLGYYRDRKGTISWTQLFLELK